MKNLITPVALVLFFLSGTFIKGQDIAAGTQVMTDAGVSMTVPAPNNSLPDSRATSITTFYSSNNFGSAGGAVYFDILVGGQSLSITAMDINTANAGAITLSVYILEGTAFGNEMNAAAWGSPVAIGTGTGAGQNNPSSLTLDTPVLLSANTNYGIAMVLDAGHSHYYTNGTGGNQFFFNEDLSLTMGSATNIPFSGGVFSPRVWNGTLYYEYGPEVPLSGWALGLGIVLIITASIIRFRRFS